MRRLTHGCHLYGARLPSQSHSSVPRRSRDFFRQGLRKGLWDLMSQIGVCALGVGGSTALSHAISPAVTERANHAKETLYEMNVDSYDG